MTKQTISNPFFTSHILQNQKKWLEMAIHNVASSGKFSSDRTIADYARDIWNVEPTWDKLPPPSEGIQKALFEKDD